MSPIAKLLAAIGASAFLAVGSLSAQTVADPADLDTRATPELRATMLETFGELNVAPSDVAVDATVGATVPDTAALQPVPEEIIAVVPETQGYEYFALPDGRIVLVHPEENTIAMILE